MSKEKVTIVTHSSKFHTDDIFAVATLLLVLEKDYEVNVVRSRDKEVIEKGDYVVDVGGIYDLNKKRFDHHQIGGAGERENGIPYASFGLVWKHYGEKVCGNNKVAVKIDEVLVQSIDAGDNGVELLDLRFKGVRPHTIIMYFESFNPTWKNGGAERINEFMKSVNLAKDYIKRQIVLILDLIEAGEIVRRIYNSSEDKRLIILDKFYPFNEALKGEEVLFSVYPQEDGRWVLKAVKEDDDSFIYKKVFPKEWAGKTGKELEEATGVLGAVSCHNNLWIATAQTKEAILKMAEIALNS